MLDYLFTLNGQAYAKAYLQQALQQPDGQFGYQNHWVIEQQGKLAAIGSAWQSLMPEAFKQATQASLQGYFSQAQLAQVIQRNQQLQAILPEPKQQQLCVGHLAVSPAFRRRGLIGTLLQTFAQQAISLGKQSMLLQVAQDNQPAISCYQKYGFVVVGQRHSPGLPIHLAMEKNLHPYY